MGVDSAALLTRWLLEPETRVIHGEPFTLDRLTVVTAMTGSESKATERAMTEHLLPLMRAHGVRFVQVCRAGESETDGILVLSDSTTTEVMHMRGPWTLADEMRKAGTIPQLSNRICSYRFKGWVLDRWAEQQHAGAQRVHLVGYAAEETGRRDRDQVYAVASPGKVPAYPLIDWGWDREQCLAYLWRVYGFEWPRSCCGFCPFQAGPDIGRLGDRWRREPEQASTAVALEVAARALNPRMKLFGTRSAADVARQFGLGDTVDAALADADSAPAALYQIRRVYRRKGDQRSPDGKGWVLGPDPAVRATKGSATWRSLVSVATGTRAELVAMLREVQAGWGGELDLTDGAARLVLREPGEVYPAVEHCLAVGPAGIPDKEQSAFGELLEFALAVQFPEPEQLDLIDLLKSGETAFG